ncbi:MAG: LacI family transcriptional regulator [Lachnospiraceae bacterium]|nr:LacI family transcriptional regulator [Lachnospiraceae bacterium]
MEQITIKEIARICGVGVSTVSRAINNHPDINEETRQKVMETIQKYNYVPNNSAQNLKRSASNTIAVLIKGISNPFFGEMIRVLERETNRQKYSFVLQHVEEFEDEVDVALRLEKEKRLKGIVFLGGVTNRTDEKLRQLHVPFVLSTADSSDLGDGFVSVSVDNEKESRRMVDYLCELGHRDIAFLTAGKEDVSVGRLRYLGYKESLKAHEIDYDESLVCWTPEGLETFSMECGYQLTKGLLDSGRAFSCIYAISDRMAIGACKALFDAGKRIPQDCSVAGFDGLVMAAFYEATLTTIRQPRREMAEATIALMFDLINKRPVENRVIFDAELVVGDSTAAPQRD